MDIKTYIESGILELYVAGTLSEKENQEVYDAIQQHPELLKEVLDIESSIVKVTASISPGRSENTFDKISSALDLSSRDDEDAPVIPIQKSKSNNWVSYTGWAASVLLAVALFWLTNQNNELKNEITNINSDKELLEGLIENANTDLAEAKNLINILRDRDIISIPLDGQAASPNAYAKIYWDKDSNSIYLDAQGLPEPPEGKVYQVWSLTLNPLSPTNLGTIDDFKTDDNKIFAIDNNNESQAFGITLEPAGGSENPTLEQLYTLGLVSATP